MHDLLMPPAATMEGGQNRKEGGVPYLSLPYPDSELGR